MGFFPLSGIQNFIESETKRTKIGEAAADVVLFDPGMNLSFRNLYVYFLFERLC